MMRFSIPADEKSIGFSSWRPLRKVALKKNLSGHNRQPTTL
jgi:hypothetical protein